MQITAARLDGAIGWIRAKDHRAFDSTKQTNTKVKGQEVAELGDVRQGYFKLAEWFYVAILVGLLN